MSPVLSNLHSLVIFQSELTIPNSIHARSLPIYRHDLPIYVCFGAEGSSHKTLQRIFRNPLYSVPIWRANAGRSDTGIYNIGWTSLSPLISCIISLMPRSIPVIRAKCHGSLLQIRGNLKPVKGNRSVYPCKYVVYRIHGTVPASHEINLRDFMVCLLRIAVTLSDKSI